MISNLGFLSLGFCLLLIALLNAQLIQAHSHGDHQYSAEGWDYSQPQRHHHGHGFHRGHGHGYNEFNDRHPEQGPGPNFGGGSYGGGHFRGGPGYGNPNYGRQQPDSGYGGQQSGTGYGGQGGFGGQPGSGFGNPPRSSYGPQTFQPRPNGPEYENEQRHYPIQPLPQPGGQDTSQLAHHQSGNAGNSWQARPGFDTNDEHSFQQPHGNTFQPRPQTSGQEAPEFDHQQSGSAASSGQARPAGDSNDENNFRQPHPSTHTGNTFQPSPQISGQETAEFNHQQSGNAGNVWQPRPVVGSSNSGEFQQPHDTQASPTFQPRPTNFEASSDSEAGNAQTYQPLPGQQHTSDGLDNLAGRTFQPRPAAQFDSNPNSPVHDNIASIFNTNEFMSPKLDDPGSRDPKAEVQPVSIDGRNLFETLPHCPERSAVRNGRCRQNA